MPRGPGKKTEKETKKRTTKKIKKDPNTPKKGMTAFLHFVQAERQKYKDANPELSHKEIISKLGTIWKSSSQAEKDPYEKKAKEDKDNYVKAKAQYEQEKKDTAE